MIKGWIIIIGEINIYAIKRISRIIDYVLNNVENNDIDTYSIKFKYDF